MAGVSITLDLDDREVLEALRDLQARSRDLSEPFADFGQYWLNATRQRFADQEGPDGTPWAPLSETTLQLKPRNQDKTLVLDGFLRDTLALNVYPDGLELGSNLPYAAIQQLGGTTSPASMIPGVEIPARPYLGFSDEDRAELLATLADHLAG